MAESLLMASLSEPERESLAPYMHARELHNGQMLLECGESIGSVWFPNDCVTSTIVGARDGSTIEVGLMGAEGMIGLSLLLGHDVSNTTVMVQIGGTATEMQADDFKEHIVKPKGTVFNRLLQYTDAFMAMVAQTAACNSCTGSTNASRDGS